MMSDSSVPDSTPQGTNCPTFNPPPLDGSYTVPELFDYNAKHNPEHPLFLYADGEKKTRTICFAEAWRMIRRTARNIQGHYKDLQDSNDVQEINGPLGQGRVIGILAIGGVCIAADGNQFSLAFRYYQLFLHNGGYNAVGTCPFPHIHPQLCGCCGTPRQGVKYYSAPCKPRSCHAASRLRCHSNSSTG